MIINQLSLFPVGEYKNRKYIYYLTDGINKVVWYFNEDNMTSADKVIWYTRGKQNAIMTAIAYKKLGIEYIGPVFTVDELVRALNNPNYCYLPYFKKPEYDKKLEKYEKRQKMARNFFKKCRKKGLKVAYKYCKYTNQVIKWIDGHGQYINIG